MFLRRGRPFMPSSSINVQGYRGLLTRYLKVGTFDTQWLRVLALVILLLGNISLQLANPQIIQMFIDSATAHATLRFLLYLALAFLGVAIAGQIVATIETYVAENVGLTATNKLRFRPDTPLFATRPIVSHRTYTRGVD